MAHSSRVRDLKRSKSTFGGRVQDENDHLAANFNEEDLTKYTVSELRDKLKSERAQSRKETSDRDATLKALQRNCEALVTTLDETRTDHTRRKDAFDALTDKYAQTELKVTAEIERNRVLRKNLHDVTAEIAGHKAAAAESKKAETKAKFDLQMSVDRMAIMEKGWDTLQAEAVQAVGKLAQTEKSLVDKERHIEGLKRNVLTLEGELTEAREGLKRSAVRDGESRHEIEGVQGRLEKVVTELTEKVKILQVTQSNMGILREAHTALDARAQDLEEKLKASDERGNKAVREAFALTTQVNDLSKQVKVGADLEQRLRVQLDAVGERSKDTAQRMLDELEANKKAIDETEERCKKLEADLKSSQRENFRLSQEVETLKSELKVRREAEHETSEKNTKLESDLGSARKEVLRLSNERDEIVTKLEHNLREKGEESESAAMRARQMEQTVLQARLEAQKEVARREREALDLREGIEKARKQAQTLEEEKKEEARKLLQRVAELSDRAANGEQSRKQLQASLSARENEVKRLESELDESRKNGQALSKEGDELKGQLQKALNLVQELSNDIQSNRQRASELESEVERRRREASQSLTQAEKAAQMRLEQELARKEEEKRKNQLQLEQELASKEQTKHELESRLAVLSGQMQEMQAQEGTLRDRLTAAMRDREGERTQHNQEIESAKEHFERELVLLAEQQRAKEAEIRGELERAREEEIKRVRDAEALHNDENKKRFEREMQELSHRVDCLKQDQAKASLRCQELEAGAVRDRKKMEEQSREFLDLAQARDTAKERARDALQEVVTLRDKVTALEKERSGISSDLARATERMTTLSGLGEKEKELARAVGQAWAASEAMEAQLTCLDCMEPFRGAVTFIPCGHTMCRCCCEKRQGMGGGSVECGECMRVVQSTLDMPALDQLASKLCFQKQALRALGADPKKR